MTDFTPWISKYGLVTMKNGDAGDAPMKSGFYYLGMYNNTCDAVTRAQLRSAYDKALATISTGPGQYCRYPEPGGSTPPWTDPKDFSRDQTLPTMVACGLMGLTGRLQLFGPAFIQNYSRAQNGDPIGPAMWAVYWRLRGWWWLWPLMCLFDLETLVNSVVQCFKGLNYDNVGDDQNHCLTLFVQKTNMPTPTSWLARKIYVWFRRGYYLSDNLPLPTWEVKGWVWAWQWYWRPETGAPPMPDLWIPLLNAALS